MCGIAGAFGWTDDAVLSEMLAALSHRGPDDEGQYVDEDAGVMLGARRLSIVDPSGGAQPMYSEDGSVVAVCNGEIYNHRSLREWLRGEGHTFGTDCDVEVVVHLWEEVGERLVDHLDGMFAFSLWDAGSETLVLARDRIGIKPLYYGKTDRGLVWGSETPALLAAGVDPRLDPAGVYDYFRLEYTPAPTTLFEDVRKLPPGRVAVVSAEDPGESPFEAVSTRRYWSPPAGRVPAAEGFDGAARRLRELLDDAVDRRLMADVPVGAFLSGGLDSSAIVGLMSERVPDLKTFAVRFPDEGYDESGEARFVADHFGTDHYEVDVDLSSLDRLAAIAGRLSEPPSHVQFLPIVALSELARDRGVRVALSGGGADELFGGYYRYDVVPERRRRLARLPDLSFAVADAAASVAPVGRLPLRYFGGLRDDESVLRRINCGFNRLPEPEEYVETDVDESRSGIDEAIADAMDRAAYDDTAHRMTTYDLLYMLPDYVLFKTDHTSMLASLEVRVPFLDRRVVEFAHRLPPGYRFGGGRKALLKRAVADVVPDRIRSREKHGMGIPVHEWFRSDHDVVARWLTETNLEATPYLDAEGVLDRWREHRRGRANHGRMLWLALSFVVWYHEMVDRYRGRRAESRAVRRR
ncbi:asparagine synthase (glutamine-hydrolyzing) [Halobacteriales archaeon QS_8_69_26]|nr:MAG: asparagine synthase (glutamine-hydrolyzing) [Halobacteriales archaeon QS_8_69_26]